MNVRASENYLAISLSSSASKTEKVLRFIGDDYFLGTNIVSFNRAVVPYEISKVNFRVEISMSEEI